jgi:hypothetical protein
LQAADAQQTLCYVGNGATGEYLSFQGAALSAANAYSLSGFRRAQNGSADVAHANGEQFVFIDDSLGKSGPLDRGLIGKTIYFKFASFNVFGGGRQSLASVPAYSYVITGRFKDILGQPVTKANSGLGIVGNLISNSAFKHNDLGWVNFSGPTPDTYVNKIEDFAGNQVGSAPRNYVLFQVGGNGSQQQRQGSPRFSVAEGQRYAYAADVWRQSCVGGVYVAWYGANDTYLTETAPAELSSNSSGSPSNLANYDRLGAFAVAPVNARYGRLIFKKLGTSVGGGPSGAWFCRPTVAIAGPAQTDLPEWDAGPTEGALSSLNLADTANLAPNSATLVGAAFWDGAGGFVGSSGYWQNCVQIAVANSSPDTAAIELTGWVSESLNAGPGSFVQSDYRLFNVTTGQVISTGQGNKQTGEGTARAVVPIVGQTSIPAGATYVIRSEVFFDGNFVGFFGSAALRSTLIKR